MCNAINVTLQKDSAIDDYEGVYNQKKLTCFPFFIYNTLFLLYKFNETKEEELFEFFKVADQDSFIYIDLALSEMEEEEEEEDEDEDDEEEEEEEEEEGKVYGIMVIKG